MVYHVAGLMSGTSLDGLDIALCEFKEDINGWKHRIIHAETFSFPPELACQLINAHKLKPDKLIELDMIFAGWCGDLLAEINARYHFFPMLAASHGHTVFHQPQKGFTLQIGNGSVIAKSAGIPVVSDFRTSDIYLGGQGAPLVPIGDRLLFGGYSGCLNLGGIANISYFEEDMCIAYDICPVNIVLNYLAQREGVPFDKNGTIASTGMFLPEVNNKLKSIPWYETEPPKSLSREQIEEMWLPVLGHKYMTADLLMTFCRHIAQKISESLKKKTGSRILVTGGGALNNYLVDELKSMVNCELIVPDLMLICYKEALVFGFLGLLRWLGRINVLASVTGASRDHCSGQVALP